MNAKDRKERPLFRGLMQYFPDACMEVAYCSWKGNEQHNPGEPMHWARGKSTDQEDCIVRHLLERGTFDDDGIRHSAKVAWRALAMLQLELEAAREQDDEPEEPSGAADLLNDAPQDAPQYADIDLTLWPLIRRADVHGGPGDCVTFENLTVMLRGWLTDDPSSLGLSPEQYDQGVAFFEAHPVKP